MEGEVEEAGLDRWVVLVGKGGGGRMVYMLGGL